jgi:hypothetical protein
MEEFHVRGINEHRSKDGTVSYRVRWYEFGGKRESATFDSEQAAIDFKLKVTANGGRGLALLYPSGQLPPAVPVEPVEPVEVPRSRITFDALFREYNEKHSRGSERTRAGNLRDYIKHVKPWLGDLVVAEISGSDGLAWQEDLEAMTVEIPKGRTKPLLSLKSVSNYRASIVTPTAKYACKMGFHRDEPAIRGDNFMEMVRPVEVPPKAKTRLRTPQDVAAFCQCAYEISQAFGDYVSLALAGAFRFGELVVLKPKAADEGYQSLFVHFVRRIDENGEVTVVADAKSLAGFAREVPIASPVWKAIVQPKLDLGPAYRDQLIVPNPEGGMWSYSTTHNMWERTLILAAQRNLFKEDMSMRNLRDSMASWWSRNNFKGIPLKKVMGHEFRSDVTIGYTGPELDELERSQALATADLLFSEWTRG